MKSFVATTFCLILILGTLAQAQGTSTTSIKEEPSEKKFSAEWRVRMTGEDWHDEQAQAKVFAVRTDLKAKYQLHSSLYLDMQPSLRLQSGTTQSVDGADRPENKITLTQAALVYRPWNPLRLSAGAMDQRYLHSRVLIDDIAFPAARAEMILTKGTVGTLLALESAIPTSTSLSTNTRELEPSPSLNTAALKLNLQGSKNLYAKFSAGYFVFNNLPSAVAQYSRLTGNEINVVSDAQYEFTHKFEGLESTFDAKTPVLSWLDLYVYGEYLVNQKAESDLNTAYYYQGAGIFHLPSAIDVHLGVGYFSIAPEAAVSYFNSNRFETNRVGYSAFSFVDFTKQNFRIGAEYTQSEVMYTNSIQSAEQKIMLKLETFYVDL